MVVRARPLFFEFAWLLVLVVQWLRKCIQNLSQSLPQEMSHYKGAMSPFGTPFKLGKAFTKSTGFVAANYRWTTNKIALGSGVALFSTDKKVAVLARVIKISRHKKKEDKVVTVMSEAGHTSKHNLQDLVPVPVPNEFLRAKTGEWYKVIKTKAKGISLANVIIPKGSHAAPTTANPAPSATPSVTPSANPATQPLPEPLLQIPQRNRLLHILRLLQRLLNLLQLVPSNSFRIAALCVLHCHQVPSHQVRQNSFINPKGMDTIV